MSKKAIVLLSGGLDSATCLAIAKDKNFQCIALSFDYGQRHSAELIAAKIIAKSLEVTDHRIVNIDIGQFGGSALTDHAINIPDYQNSNQIPVTYVPARNTVFLSIALSLAEAVGAHDIFIGVSAIDYSNYPDCRPEFISSFEKMANLATKAGMEKEEFTIHAPLISLTKAETIQIGNKLQLDYSLTVSCYQANSDGAGCGRCDSCELRKLGFAEAGLIDPTKYWN